MCPIPLLKYKYENHLRDMGHYFIAGNDVTPISPLDVGFAGNDGEYGKPAAHYGH